MGLFDIFDEIGEYLDSFDRDDSSDKLYPYADSDGNIWYVYKGKKYDSFGDFFVPQVAPYIDANAYDRALNELEKIKNYAFEESFEDNRWYYYWLKAHSYTYKLLSVKEQGASDSDIEYLFNQGLLACNEGETFSYENKVRLSKILILKALLYDCVGDINGRKYLIGALDTNDSDDKQYAWNLYINATEWLKKIFENHHNLDYKEGDESFSGEDIYKDVFMFTKMPEEERKFIYIVQDDNSISGCYDSKGNIDWVFTKQYYPSDIAFPLGHPVSNTLYVLNPTNKYEYLPYAEASEILFDKKVHELCYLLQCLGAKEIEIEYLSGEKISTNYLSDIEKAGNVGYKSIKANRETHKSNDISKDVEKDKALHLSHVFSPQKYPFCPDGLFWMDVEEKWKYLVKQRLEGGLLSFNEKISTKDICNVSSNVVDELSATVSMFMANVGLESKSRSISKEFRQIETEWEVSAKFVPLNEFNEKTSESQKLANDEQEYLEEVKACLEEEGSISERERRLLDKFRAKLGISKDRAEELEKMCNAPALTEDEKEYLDEYKLRMEDGVIDEKDRKRLDRLKNILDISDERANEIEKMA